jgi:hypothetical protein
VLRIATALSGRKTRSHDGQPVFALCALRIAPHVRPATGRSIETAVLAQPHDRAGEDSDVTPVRSEQREATLYFDER